MWRSTLPRTSYSVSFATAQWRGVSGRQELSIATGLRYKFSECTQVGLAAEFPLNGNRDIQDFRLTIDLIFRY